MSLGSRLDGALAPGTVQAHHDGAEVEVDVVDVDRLGARVRAVRVDGGRSVGITTHAERLPQATRALPDVIVPVEVSPVLGGAVLRSAPGDMVDCEFFEVRTNGRRVEVERVRGGTAAREVTPFTVTREQLRKLVDGVAGSFGDDD